MKNAAKWARKAAALAVSSLALVAVLANLAAAADFDELYFHRNEGDNLQKNIQELSLSVRSGGMGGGSTDAGALWRLCRAKVRRGESLKKKSERLAEYESAKLDCESSLAVSTGTADAHFWHGVALGRWAETKGMMKALFAIKTIKKDMAATLALDPSHGGAHNVLAEILWQLPGFAGGDKKKALAEFETALKLSPRYTANHQPLAEAYLHFGRKEDAIKVLKLVEAIKDPADPAEYPDNLADAKKLLEKLEK
ncbi:MAG: TRAP transporter TatT component family protein [Elusimicrobiota bacterium]|nr:MAG: TRAP transporter TatT component family protein [Elusimicrobiota bacterium]